MSAQFTTAMASLLTAGLLATSAIAAPITLVNDPFTDGGRTNGTDPQDIAFFNSGFTGGGSSFGVENDPVLASNALRTVPGTFTFVKFVGFFDAVTLAAGDSLTLSFNYRVESAPNQASALRFGLLNSAGTRQTSDGSSTLAGVTRTDDSGYGIATNIGATGSNTTTNREPAGDDTLGGSNFTPFGSNAASVVHDPNTVYSATLTLARTATGLDLSGSLAGVTIPVRSDATPVTSTFDQIAFGTGNASFNFSIDNVSVTTTAVPEPTAMALMAAAVPLLIRRRRV
jgi:hypothetical protein